MAVLKEIYSILMTWDWNTIGKIILGSGLIAVFMKEVIFDSYRKWRLKKRLVRELAHELFRNEIAVILIIRAWKYLLKNPLECRRRYKTFHNVSGALLSSGYFVTLEPDLVQFILEIDMRFKIIEFELEEYFRLTDAEKTRNIRLIPTHLENAKNLYNDLLSSKKYKEMKINYRDKWKKEKLKTMPKAPTS